MASKTANARCDECGLCNEPFVPPHGPPNEIELIVVGEAPGREEVSLGQPFVGQSGRLLNAAIQKAGRDPINIYKTNTVLCRPPMNREPTPQEIECCRERLNSELDRLNCHTIVVLGKTAINTLLGIDGVTQVRGAWFEWRGRRVMPTLHPAYILRKPSEAPIFVGDIAKAYRAQAALKKPDVTLLETATDVRDWLTSVPMGSVVTFDIETDQVVWYDRPSAHGDPILLLAISCSSNEAAIIGDEALYDTPGVAEALNSFFDRKDLTFVAHNGKFDALFLRHIGINARVDFDTMLAHYALDERPGTQGLKACAKEEFGLYDYEEDLVQKYLKSRNDHYSKVPFDQLAQYAGWDVVVTLALYHVFWQRLMDWNLMEWPFRRLLMPAQAALMELEWRGIAVDVPYLTTTAARLEREIEEQTAKLREMSNTPDLNPASPIQLAVVLYDKLHMPQLIRKGVKPRSTNHEVLEWLGHAYPSQFIKELLRHRKIAKIKSSYIDNLIEFADLQGRVHASFKITGTETGRLAAADPALQTIPRTGDPYGALVRGAFVAGPGRVFVIADYSQAELRVMAALSRDPFLIQVYKDGRDLHTEVAKAMFGDHYTKEQRVMCKMFNFAWAYGGNEYSFAQDQGLPLGVAKEFVRKYNLNMAGAVAWKTAQAKLIRQRGYVDTRFGRRRRFMLLTQENAEEADKAAINMPVQSTASDLTLTALTRLMAKGIDIVLTVHDSLIAEASVEDAEAVGELMRQAMVDAGNEFVPEVPWKVDVEVRPRWGEVAS
jgi:DNA polymerase I